MCGRYTLTRQDGVVEEMQAILSVSAAHGAWWRPRFNIAPTQPAPVVVARDGVRSLELYRWGLVPPWVVHPEPGGKRAPLMINARVETVLQKPVFRGAFERHRCLVPADGFFEWTHAGKATPQPRYFRPVPRRVVAFAGICTRAEDLYSFAILTGPANALVAAVHDRMPIVLDPSTYGAWLDPALDSDGALALLTVPPIDDWQAAYVSTAVNAAAHDEPALIEPIAPPVVPPPKQGSLF
ncbi:MAG: SOS response-associated peptidase [Proteobacteria bacterium]|nr:SOS response-associated peptidase [Pseudomonadota bacterium]